MTLEQRSFTVDHFEMIWRASTKHRKPRNIPPTRLRSDQFTETSCTFVYFGNHSSKCWDTRLQGQGILQFESNFGGIFSSCCTITNRALPKQKDRVFFWRLKKGGVVKRLWDVMVMEFGETIPRESKSSNHTLEGCVTMWDSIQRHIYSIRWLHWLTCLLCLCPEHCRSGPLAEVLAEFVREAQTGRSLWAPSNTSFYIIFDLFCIVVIVSRLLSI